MYEIITQLIITIGIPAIIGALIYIGKKLQILDDLKKQYGETGNFCKSATNSIVEIQTHLAHQGFIINNKLAYDSNSPIKLTEWGETLMEKSGFRKIINDPEKRQYLITLVKAKKPQTNYDIQQYSMDVMEELAEVNDPAAVPLKEHAYKEGMTLDIILKSAGIVLRDEIMKELKFDDKI